MSNALLLAPLEESLGYAFKNKSLLLTALTHSSYVNERKMPKSDCNERLEFLGDSVLGFVAAEYLYAQSPAVPEGQMTKRRAELVCEAALFECAKSVALGGFLQIGKGEEQTGGRSRPSVCSDAVEAIIAAAYLDGGIDAAKGIIYAVVLSGERGANPTDYKTVLQELVQRSPGASVAYEIVGSDGPEHDRVFRSRASASGKSAEGEGRTKKAAEQAAAKELIKLLT
ncbi:MAG: ribonuclease III [Oscillospiraceae bacterium]|jgi:ribonuclease-3|nr:ribonuclease III [Oscillospiraceae bacterium]